MLKIRFPVSLHLSCALSSWESGSYAGGSRQVNGSRDDTCVVAVCEMGVETGSVVGRLLLSKFTSRLALVSFRRVLWPFLNYSGDGVTFRVTDSAGGWVRVEFFPRERGRVQAGGKVVRIVGILAPGLSLNFHILPDVGILPPQYVPGSSLLPLLMPSALVQVALSSQLDGCCSFSISLA